MSSASDSSTSGSVNKWIGLVAASTGIFLGSLDITVNVALPNITSSFGADVQTVQWIIIFYVGSSAGLQISLGSAADAYGLKRFFIIGLVVYTLAVLLISLAPLLQIVFGLRVLQAVGNGLLMACAPALVTSMFPGKERGKALGLMAGLGTLGMLVGTLAGGVLVDSFGWRAIFAARVPLGVCAIALSLAALSERPLLEARRGFDFRGAFTLFTGLVSFILFLALGGRMGWTDPVTLTLAPVSLASLAAFVYIEGRVRLPVLDVGLLRHRVLAPAFISAYLISMSSFVNWFILPFFVSDVMGANAKTWGMLMMLMPLTVAASAPIGGWVSDRVPPAYVNTVAAVMTAATVFSYVMLGEGATVFDVAWMERRYGGQHGPASSFQRQFGHGLRAIEQARHRRRHHDAVAQHGQRIQRSDTERLIGGPSRVACSGPDRVGHRRRPGGSPGVRSCLQRHLFRRVTVGPGGGGSVDYILASVSSMTDGTTSPPRLRCKWANHRLIVGNEVGTSGRGDQCGIRPTAISTVVLCNLC